MAKKSLPVIAWVFIGLFACALALGLASYVTVQQLFQNKSSSPAMALRPSNLFGSSKYIGILRIEGAIMNPVDIFESLDEIEESTEIKALVVRINSPGGSVPPTQEIFNRLLKLREKIPLICSLADIAASGGYYIAAACNKIYVNPGTLTGSIGVIMQLMNIEELYKWAKVQPVTMKSGKFKDIGSPFRAMRDDEKELLQALIDDTHEQFKSDIAKGRNMARSAIDPYADGRIFSGSQALSYGFADASGGIKDALDDARKEAGVDKNTPTIEWPKKKEGFRSFLEGQMQNLVGAISLRKQILGDGLKIQQGIPYFLPSHIYGNGL